MNRNTLLLATGVILTSFLFQGFQCGSPEFTGAKVYINQKNYKEAIRLLEIETQKNPANEEAWYMLGGLRSEAGDYAGMNVAFTEALKLSPKHAKEIAAMRYNKWANHVNSGVNNLQRATADSLQFYDKAIDEFTKAKTSWPDTMVTYRYLGYAYTGKGDLDNAIAAFGIAWKKGKDTESHKRAGRIYLMRGKEKKSQFETENVEKIRALSNLQSVEKGTPKADVMKMLGAPDNVVKGPKGTRKEDWKYPRYNLVVSIDGDRVASRTMTAPYNPNIDSTKYKAALVDFANSVELFEEVKNVDNKDNENLNLLLQGYVEANRIKDAIRGFKQAVLNEPGSKFNHYILGVLYRSDGDFKQAIPEFEESLKIDPAYAEALFDLGATYYNWGVDMIRKAQESGQENDEYKAKFQAAVPYLEKVTELKKDDASVWETLGTIYARLGQSEKAMKALDSADKIRKGN